MNIIKIGGSLATRKSAFCEFNDLYVDQFATAFLESYVNWHGGLILVLGGGSFGSGTMLKLGLDTRPRQVASQDIPAMTVAMLGYLVRVAEIFRQRQIPVFPLQIGPLSFSDESLKLLSSSLESILRAGAIPIVASDYFDSAKSGWQVIPSDRILVALALLMRPIRVCALTDTPGIYQRDTKRKIAVIDRSNCEWALNQTERSDNPDATGGMRAKLDALLEIAELGVESSIIDARIPSIGLEACFGDWSNGVINGTVIRPRHSLS